MHVLHKLPDQFVVTSDERLTEGVLSLGDLKYKYGTNISVFKKTLIAIATQNRIDFSDLSQEVQKKIGWFDIEKLAEKECDNAFSIEWAKDWWFKGFKKAQELISDRMFTLEEMKTAFHKGREYGSSGINSDTRESEFFTEFIPQLKSWEVEGEWSDGKFKITKIL